MILGFLMVDIVGSQTEDQVGASSNVDGEKGRTATSYNQPDEWKMIDGREETTRGNSNEFRKNNK